MPKIWRGRGLIKDGVIKLGLDEHNIVDWSKEQHKNMWEELQESTGPHEAGVLIKVECIEEDDGTITNIR